MARRDLGSHSGADELSRALVEVDQLHRLWKRRQRLRPPDGWALHRDEALRHHCAELQTMRRELRGCAEGRGGALDPVEAARGLSGALARAREGEPFDAALVSRLAVELGSGAAEAGCPPPEIITLASARAHPVVRAARVLYRAVHWTGSPGDPLPWALASHLLVRAHYPPLIADRVLGAALLHALAREPEARITASCAEVAGVSLRTELSWPAPEEAADSPEPSGRLLAETLKTRIERWLDRVLNTLVPGVRMARYGAQDPAGEPHGELLLGRAAELGLYWPRPEWVWSEVRPAESFPAPRLVVGLQPLGTPPSGALVAAATVAHGESGEICAAESLALPVENSADELWPRCRALLDRTAIHLGTAAGPCRDPFSGRKR